LRRHAERVTLGTLALREREHEVALLAFRGQEVTTMIGLDTTVARLPIVLIVDPIAASRFTMWRLLSRSFGVLEAEDARHACEWLDCRKSIDALIVQKELPDAYGGELVQSLLSARVTAASRVIIVERPIDFRSVVTRLADWFFSREARKADALLRAASRLVS
jgi:response regulator RpfG family c-di-GMP phosphodiesterase